MHSDGVRVGARDLLATIVESSEDAILTKALDGTATSWNEGATRLYGYGADEIVGRPVAVLYPPDQTNEERRVLAAVTRGERVAHYETRRVRRDGTLVDVSISVSPILDASGTVTGAAAIARDITDRLRAEARLQGLLAERERLASERDQLRVRQSERMESLGQLAGGIAHDCNNLLQVILGYGRFLAKAVAADPELSRDVTEIVAAAERAATLTRQLLIFGRREVTRPETLDLGAVVTALEPLLRRTVGGHIEFDLEVGPTLPTVLADRSQLEQVIVNLAANARDAMPGGGVLYLRTDRVGSAGRPAVRPTVADTGCGMSPEVRTRIFEPFFTTRPKGHGTGLGLATVYATVAQAGGSIDVYSEEGHGTSVKITWPAVDNPSAEPSPAERRPTPKGRGRVAMVAEDEPGMRRMIARVLADAGYQVWAADTPERALAWCRSGTVLPDILVTDVVMPKISGPELAAAVTAQLPDVPVVYLSGYSRNIIARQGALDPGVTLVEKPFTDSDLLGAVATALGDPAG